MGRALESHASAQTSSVKEVGSISSGSFSTAQMSQANVEFDIPDPGTNTMTTLDFEDIMYGPPAPEIGSGPPSIKDMMMDMSSDGPNINGMNPTDGISGRNNTGTEVSAPVFGGGPAGAGMMATSIDASPAISFSGTGATSSFGGDGAANASHGDGSAIGGNSANGTDSRQIYARDANYVAPGFSTYETDLDVSELLKMDPMLLQEMIGKMTQEEYQQFIQGVEGYYGEQIKTLRDLLGNMESVYDELFMIEIDYEQRYNVSLSLQNIESVMYERINNLYSGFHPDILDKGGITLEEFQNMEWEEQIEFVKKYDPYVKNSFDSYYEWLAEIDAEIAAECADYNIHSLEELHRNVEELRIKIEETKQSISALENFKTSAKFDYLAFTADYATFEAKTITEENLTVLEQDSDIVDPNESFWSWILFSRDYHCKTYSYSYYHRKHPEVSPLEYMRMVEAANPSGNYDIRGIPNYSSMKTIIQASQYLPEFEKTYNYLYNKNPQLAEEYIKSVQYQINNVEGQIRAQRFLSSLNEKGDNADALKAFENELGVSLEGLIDGLTSFGEGVGYSIEALVALFTKNYNRTMSAEEYKRMYILYALMSTEAKVKLELITKNDDGTYSNVDSNSPIDYTKNYAGVLLSNNYELSQGIGNMIPSIALSTINPTAGMCALGISAGGNAYHNAMVKGHDYFSSLLYGVATGFSESVTEKLLGGLPGLSDFPVTSWKTYFQAMGREFTQESLQGALDLVVRDAVLGEKLPPLSDADAWIEIGLDLLKQGGYGALTAGILQVPSFAINSYNLKKLDTFMTQNGISPDQQQAAIKHFRNSDSKYANMSDVEIKLKFAQQVATQAMIYQTMDAHHITEEVAKVMLALNVTADIASYMVENNVTLEEAQRVNTIKIVEAFFTENHVTAEEQQMAFDAIRNENPNLANLSNEDIMSSHAKMVADQIQINRYVMVGIKPEVAALMVQHDINERTATYMLENNASLEAAVTFLSTGGVHDYVAEYDLSKYDVSTYGLDRIMSDNFRLACNVFFDMAPDQATRDLLAEVLFSGKVGDFNFDTQLANRGNPTIEGSRRVAMANLLIQSPETFQYICDNQIDLFHGTRGVALASILENGMVSLSTSQSENIEIKTGEEWSRIAGHPRSFISFADDIGTAMDYSEINKLEPGGWNFPVVIGTTSEAAVEAGTITVWSDIAEIGVRGKLSADKISCIIVPSDKVELVEELVGDSEIKVLAFDKPAQPFFDTMGEYIHVYPEEIEKYRQDLDIKRKTLELAERYNMTPEEAKLLIINSEEAAPYLIELHRLAAEEGMTLKEYGSQEGNERIDPIRQLQADTLAAQKRALAVAAEPKISQDMLSLSNENRRLVGYSHRLKGEESISRKILFDSNRTGISLEEACDRIGDSVRYTLVCDEATFTEQVRSGMEALIAKGYTVNHFRNTFDKAMYKGVNVSLISPDGIVMELQFHTEESYYAKEEQSHVIYEIARNDYVSPEAKKVANVLRRIVASHIDMPPDVMSLTEAEFKRD